MLDNYPDVVSTKELCEILRVGKKRAIKLLVNGEISNRKIRNHYYISKKSIIEFLNSAK